MKNYTIPAILVVAIIAAGAFAFTPIDQATAVHDTIIDTITINIAENSAQLVRTTDADLNDLDTLTFSCNADYIISGITLDLTGINPGDNDSILVTIDGDDVANVLLDTGPVAVLDGSEAALAGTNTVLDFSITETGDEVLDAIRISVASSGDCAFQ